MSENKLEKKQNTQIERTKVTKTEFAAMHANNNIGDVIKGLENFTITNSTSGDRVDLNFVEREESSITVKVSNRRKLKKINDNISVGVLENEEDLQKLLDNGWKIEGKISKRFFKEGIKESKYSLKEDMITSIENELDLKEDVIKNKYLLDFSLPLFNKEDFHINHYYSKWLGPLGYDWFQTLTDSCDQHEINCTTKSKNYAEMRNGLNCSFKCLNLNCEIKYCKQWKNYYNHIKSCDEYDFIRDKIKKCSGNIPMDARCKKCVIFCKWINNFEKKKLLDDDQVTFFNKIHSSVSLCMYKTEECKQLLDTTIKSLYNIVNNKYTEKSLKQLTLKKVINHSGQNEFSGQHEFHKYISLLPNIHNIKIMALYIVQRTMVFIMNCHLFTMYFKKSQMPKNYFKEVIKDFLRKRHFAKSNIIDHGDFYLDLFTGTYLKSFVKDYRVHSKIGKLMLKWYSDTKSKRFKAKEKLIVSCIKIQRITRGFIKRKLYRMKRSSIIRIQKIVRGYFVRRIFVRNFKANLKLLIAANANAVRIQKLFRGFITRKNKLLILAEITGNEQYLDESISIIKRLEFQIKSREKIVYNNMKFIANIKKNKSKIDPVYFFPKNKDYRFWNIRNGPYFSNPVISEIDAGDAFQIISPIYRTRDGDWFKIKYCRDCGYICDNLIAGKGIIGFVSIKDNPFERPEPGFNEEVMKNLTNKEDQYEINLRNIFGRQYLFPHSTKHDLVHEISKNVKKTQKKINKLKEKLKDEKYKEEDLRFIRKERKKREVQKEKLLLKKEEVEKTKEVRKIPEIRIEIKNSFGGNIKTKRGGEHRKWKEKRKSELSKITNISTGKKKVSPKKDQNMGRKKAIVGNLFKKKSISPKKRIKRKETMSGYVENKRSVLPKVYSKEEREKQIVEYDKKEKLKYKRIFPDVIKYHLQLDHSLPEEAGGGYIYVDCHKKNMIDIRELIIEIVKENSRDYSFQGIILNIGSGIILRPKLKNIYSKWESLTEENHPILFEFKRRLKEIKRDINFTIKEVQCINKEYSQLLYVGI